MTKIEFHSEYNSEKANDKKINDFNNKDKASLKEIIENLHSSSSKSSSPQKNQKKIYIKTISSSSIDKTSTNNKNRSK